MDLEIIERGSSTSSHPTLLFVHGFWQAAWTWDEFVMPQLEERGYHCLAVSLRGHGGSEGKIRGSSIADYVADVRSVVDTLSEPPVIVGHSMGGFTTQHYLAVGDPARAVVLVSPVPRKGAWGATWKLASKHPLVFGKINLTLDVGPAVETRDRAHEFLVASSFPVDEMDRYMDRLERASYRVYMSMLLDRPDLSNVDLPALVIGGSEDGFFTEGEWRDTADALGADLSVLDGIGHQPMWEGEGRRLVEEIDGFLTGLN
ncbi:MAG: alpha/beta fold hydrolase [Acidimicrobiia bacterium]